MSLTNTLETLLSESSSLLKEKDLIAVRVRLIKDMKKVFAKQEEVFLSEMEHYRGLFTEVMGQRDIDAIMAAVSAVTDMELGTAIIAATTNAMKLAFTHRIADIGIDISFDLKNPRAVQWLTDNAALKVSGINDTTRKEIARIVTQGADEGWSYNQMAKEISSRFKEFRIGKPQAHIESRAHGVAVTEVGQAYEEGNAMVIDQMQDVGIELEKKWLVTGGNICEDCEGNENEGWIPNDQTHQSGHQHPLAHPYCRCTELYRRKGSNQEAMRDRVLKVMGLF